MPPETNHEQEEKMFFSIRVNAIQADFCTCTVCRFCLSLCACCFTKDFHGGGSLSQGVVTMAGSLAWMFTFKATCRCMCLQVPVCVCTEKR